LIHQPTPPVLKVHNLAKGFAESKPSGKPGGKPVVHTRQLFESLNFELAEGEFVALVGESGSGKSTLLNLLAGLEMPDHGEISIDGTELGGLDSDGLLQLRRNKIGFVFQAFHLITHLDALQNTALPLLLRGEPVQNAYAAAQSLLVQLGLGERLHANSSELSGGEQQRIALARALIHQPRLILADEPTGNLDPESANSTLSLLQTRAKEMGAAVLMVTHSTSAAARAHRCLNLRNGTLFG
jgi:putative ABC transport system ATP-binding protein